ncbi:hypothetical protein KCU95_g8192, partial [Aureobasidium melanogenum]
MAFGDIWKMEFGFFMRDCPGTTNKNWGFYVYFTYDRTDEVHDNEVVAKLRGYSEALFKHLFKQPYGERMNAALHLDDVPLHGASSDQVRLHFKMHYRTEKFVGPRNDVVLVVDDEVLESVQAGPPPMINLPGHTGADSRYYARTKGPDGEDDIFVKALQLRYTGGEEGKVCQQRPRWRGSLERPTQSLSVGAF